LLDKDYGKARRLLEMHCDLVMPLSEMDPAAISSLLMNGQSEKRKHHEAERDGRAANLTSL
jgi:hypothetical protein